MHAYVDESARDGLYLMAAVLVPPDRGSEIRFVLHEALRRDQRRYHWHDEDAPSRMAMAERVGSFALDAVVVVESAVDSKRLERARRHCLLRLLWEIGRRDIHEVLIESRHRSDAHDRRVIGAVQRSGQALQALRFRFGSPYEESLLWLPDVVAGAAAAMLGRGERQYFDRLGDAEVIAL